MAESSRTASDVLLESLCQGGVDVAFANFGTDHTGLIEAFARHEAPGLPPVPRLLLCLHEGVAIHAALGYAHFTGRAQAVLVHVDVGTANVGVGLHNASRSALPVFVFAGVAPWTEFGEQPGSRDNVVHWVQDVYDQPGSIREYLKWEYQLRTGINVDFAVARALQIANAPPQGPVYLTAAREPLAEPFRTERAAIVTERPRPVVPDAHTLDELIGRLRAAERPVVLTSAAGRAAAAVAAMVALAETFAVPVVEVRPQCVNMPADHPLHLGYQPRELVQAADLILAIECPLPWVPVQVQPQPQATVVWLGADPLGSFMPMRSLPGHIFAACDVLATLRELVLRGQALPPENPERLAARQRELAAQHAAQVGRWQTAATGGSLTAAAVARLVAELAGADAVMVEEAITLSEAVVQQIQRRKPGTFMGNGGSGLGMGLPAALGAKLAVPDADVVAFVGDGSYLFGEPPATHWSAQAWGAPFLTVILNNHRWEAVVRSTRQAYPQGLAARQGVPQARFHPPPDLAAVCGLAGGVGMTVRTIGEAEAAIRKGLALIRQGTSTVVDVRLAD